MSGSGDEIVEFIGVRKHAREHEEVPQELRDRVPPGEVYFPIEGPRGEYGCFVRSDGSAKPARMHMRDPSFVNLQATADIVRGSYIADFIASLAMIDPILGGVDR